MEKKDKPVDADPLAHLEKDERKRLEKLADEWGGGSRWSKELYASDLRLLLENFRPLHDLIRQIAATSSGQSASSATGLAAQAEFCAQSEVERNEAEVERQALQAQLVSSQAEVEQLRRQLADERRQAGELEKELKRLTQLLAAGEQELAKLRQQPELPPVLELLRNMPALASRLELGDLPVDANQALIRAVAVLSQLNNVERLWDALKDSCESEHRPASDDEITLLQTALDWHNHNWRKKPYTLYHPRIDAGFDFKTAQRAATTPSGETLTVVWLPGIMSGSDSVQKKALVATR